MNPEITNGEHFKESEASQQVSPGDLVASKLDMNMRGRVQEFFTDTDEKGGVVKVAKVKMADGREYTARPDQLIKIE